MALLICAATGRELAALAPTLLPGGEALEEMRLWSAPLKGRETLFCVTGVGPLNAALALGRCFGQAGAEGRRIDAVLNTGLAGAFDLAALPLRALCLVREEIWPEYGLHDGQSVTARAFSFPLWRGGAGNGGADVYDRLPLAGTEALPGGAPRSGGRMFTPCRSLTVAGVSASFARARELWNRHHAELENMEGFAVAYACARAGVPCVEIRCVSNKVGPRTKEEKDFPGALQSLDAVLPSLNLL
ncbi:futalosine hydrolase [Desulfovibrio sp. SGI.169]|uniref:futalosine hydrolase n=1 Tax=Desulfovibrio sp. SGI.169 TaxID=3420561 RepID=UPI003D00CEFF